MTTLAAYTKLERIGRGSYGEVFKVRRHSDGTTLVLKEVSMVGITEQEEREIMNETSCMVQLSHPNIIAFVGSFLERGALHIVMEFASGGDLQCLIRRHVQTGTFLSEDRLWKFLIQLSQGLQHAHSRRILHRDIKASNVFIDANDDIKIGDLGLGKILGEWRRCRARHAGDFALSFPVPAACVSASLVIECRRALRLTVHCT
jgi:serine/threonine protein kinase